MLAVAMLEIGGFKTFVACNGLEALQQLTKHPEVSAVLLDLLMPVMNGADALREMRKLWPAVRVILVSGFEESETTHRFGEQAPNAFLQKPFTLEMLTGAVRSSLN